MESTERSGSSDESDCPGLIATIRERLKQAGPRLREQARHPSHATIVNGCTLLCLIGLSVFDVDGLVGFGIAAGLAALLGHEHRKERRLKLRALHLASLADEDAASRSTQDNQP
jgi:hypothetical protein